MIGCTVRLRSLDQSGSDALMGMCFGLPRYSMPVVGD